MKTGEYLLKEEKVGRAMLGLVLPGVLSTMASTIYNFTDTYFIGLLRDTQQLSALSLAMPLMWLAGALSGVIGAGAGQVISLLLGKGERQGLARCRSFAVFGTLALSLLLTPLMLVCLRPALSMMGAQGAVLEYAAEYLQVIVGATAISAVSGAMQGVLRADGRTALSSIGSGIGILLNIVLDPILILAMHMGVRGAAIATALGSLASLIFCTIAVRKQISLRCAVPGWKIARQTLSLSMASTCTSVLNALIVALSFSVATGFGDGVVAAISVASKLYSFVVSVVSAIAFGMQPFVGYNFAAQSWKRLKEGIGCLLCTGTLICLVATAAFLLLGNGYMRLFTQENDVIEAGSRMIRTFAIGAPIVAVNMTAMMFLGATGKAWRSLLAGLSRQILIYMPVMLILQHFFGLDGLIVSYPVTDLLSTALAVALCAGDIKRIFAQQA